MQPDAEGNINNQKKGVLDEQLGAKLEINKQDIFNKLQGFIDQDLNKQKSFNLYEKNIIIDSDTNIYGKKRKNY